MFRNRITASSTSSPSAAAVCMSVETRGVVVALPPVPSSADQSTCNTLNHHHAQSYVSDFIEHILQTQ